MSVSKLEVAIEIENLRKNIGDGTYLDAILVYCENNNIDVDDRNSISKLLSPNLKHRIQQEVMKLKLLKENNVNVTSLEI